MGSTLPFHIWAFIGRLTEDPVLYGRLASAVDLRLLTNGYLRSQAIETFSVVTTHEYGAKEWQINGKRHRENDQHALILKDGTKYWYINGKKHRENDQPAIIYTYGTKEWYKNGKRHRENDQPAVISSNGAKEWWVNGQRIK